MNWVLMYLSMSFNAYAVQTGMHTTGPFLTRDECEIYAEQTWSTDEWEQQEDVQNFYDSRLIIHHLEHNNSNMAVFYSCVKVRDPKKWREN